MDIESQHMFAICTHVENANVIIRHTPAQKRRMEKMKRERARKAVGIHNIETEEESEAESNYEEVSEGEDPSETMDEEENEVDE